MRYLLTVLLIVCVLNIGALENPVLRYFNGDCIGFAAVEQINLMDADYKNTAMGKIWAEPEVQAFLAGLISDADGLLKKAADESGFDFKEIIAILRRLEGGAGICLTDIDFENEIPGLIIVINGINAEDREKSAVLIGKLEGMIADEIGASVKETIAGREIKVFDTGEVDEPVLCYSYTDGELLISLSREAMTAALNNAAKKETAPALQQSLEVCKKGERGGITAFADFNRISKLIKDIITMEEGADSEEMAIANALHLEDITAIALSSSIFKSGFYNRVFLGLAPEPKGIGRIFQSRSIDEGLVANIPDNVTAFSAGYFNIAILYDTLLDIFTQAAPEEAMQLTAMIGAMEMPLGVKIREELIESFDGDMYYFQRLPVGFGQQVPELTFVIKLKTAVPLQTLLTNYIEPMAVQQGVGITKSMVGDIAIHTVQIPNMNMPGVMPSFAITKDALIIGINQNALKAGLSKPAKTVIENPAYAALEKILPTGSPVSVSFTDIKQTFSKAYQTIGMAIGFMPGIGARVGIDVTKMPLTETIAKHLFGMKSVSKKVDGGLATEIYGPVDYVTGIGAVAAGAAVIYPRVEEARQGNPRGRRGQNGDPGDGIDRAAGAVMTDVKLKQLFQACNIYYFDNDGRFPARLSELYPDYVMETSLFTKDGRELNQPAIDAEADFVLIPNVTMDNGEAVLIYLRSDGDTVKAVRVDGAIVSVPAGDIPSGTGR